jgi:uncharacterized protein YfcZ (UPF0381/DUF406 family)
MKLIKKYWLAIAAAIAGIVGFILLNNNKSKSVKAINKEIDDNEKAIEVLDEKIEAVEEARVEVIENIEKHEDLIEVLEDKKENLVIEELPVEEAKENILAKTSRGRKKKK